MASKAKRPHRQASRRATPKTTRAPGLPGPTPEQLEAAIRATKDHQTAPGWDASALAGFHKWLSALNDPFARVYLDSFPQPDSTGRITGTAESSDPDELRALAHDAIGRFTAEQDACLHRLTAAIENVDPAPLLAGMMFLTRMERWGSYYEPHAEPRFLDLEVVGAIVSGLTYGERRPATADDLWAVRHAAKELRYWAQALAAAYAAADEHSPRSAMRRELLERWLTWRGSAYPHHARSLAHTLASHVGKASGLPGFAVADLLDFAAALERRWEQVLSPSLDAAWTFARSATGEQPTRLGSASPKFLDAYMEALMLLLPAVLGISAQGGSVLDGAREVRERAIIGSLGARPGTGQPVTSVLVDPPQRSRPFLLLPQPLWVAEEDSTELALLVNPDALSTEAHLTVDALMSRTVANWPVTRARAVDKHAAELLRKALPGAEVFTNVYLDGPSGREEMDGLVVYEDIVIVVEGKGAPLKLAARRGSVDKLVGQLGELVSDGYRQLERDRAYVRDGRPARFYNATGEHIYTINGDDVRRCYQLLPTLDGIADLGAALPRLADLGVLPSGASPWIIGLTDLQIVAEVLDRPAQLVAYMDFRQRWANEARGGCQARKSRFKGNRHSPQGRVPSTRSPL